MIVCSMKLSPGQDHDVFIRFMSDEYLPALRRGPTRIGQASYVELFQGNTTGTQDQFVLLVEGLMNLPSGFAGRELEEKLERFGVQLDDGPGDMRSVAQWRDASEPSPSI